MNGSGTCRWARLAALALLVAAGCGGSASSSRATTLVFTGLGGEPDSLNPLLSSSADLYNLSHLYISDLLESDDRGRLIPEVAREVPSRQNGGISADGRTIVYHLRSGVRWQDGAPLGARDVVFSYRAVMNPENNVAFRVGYAEIAAISAPGPLTVVLRLRRPFSPILVYFCGPQGFGIFPEHLLARYRSLNRVAYNQLPVGSGPYRVVSWRRGDEVTFAANPSYWRGPPRIARLIYRIVPDPSTRLAELEAGEVDAYFGVDPQQMPQLRRIAGVTIIAPAVADLHVLQFNLADPTLRDVRIRRAVALAIDRRKLLEIATFGTGIAVDGDQPRNGWGYAGDAPAVTYDPAAAGRLLDAAGWVRGSSGARVRAGRPLELTLAIAPQGITGSTLVATVIQRYLEDVGIPATIKQYSPGLMWEPKAAGGVLASGRYQLAYNAWWILGPDPDDSWQFACDQVPPAGENYYAWCNPRADAAIHDALQTFDQRRRKADYAVVQRELRNDLPELTLWQIRMPYAYRRSIDGFSPSPFGSAFWNAWTWSL